MLIKILNCQKLFYVTGIRGNAIEIEKEKTIPGTTALLTKKKIPWKPLVINILHPSKSLLLSILDAAKRKQLPAWIREGLEKMEREKQRKLDKERMDRERDEQLRIQQEAEQEVLLKMNSVEAAKLLAKSKFDSDGSDSEAVKEEPTSPKIRKSRFHNPPIVEPPPAPKITTRPPRKEHRSPSPQLGPPKSREEILEDVVGFLFPHLNGIQLSFSFVDDEGAKNVDGNFIGCDDE